MDWSCLDELLPSSAYFRKVIALCALLCGSQQRDNYKARVAHFQMTSNDSWSSRVLPKNSFETAVKRNSNFSVKLQKCISCSRVYRISRVISYAFIIWRLKVYISKLDLWVEEQVLTPELGQLHSPECLIIFIRSIEILNECKFDDEMTELLIIVFKMPFMVKVFASCFKFIPDKFNALLDIWHPLPTSRRWTCHDPQRQFSHAIFM